MWDFLPFFVPFSPFGQVPLNMLYEMSCHSLSPLFVLLNARKKRLKQVWEFFWHLWEVCGCRVFLFNFLFLWVNLLEKWPRHIFFQLQMRNVWVKEYVFSSMMRILLNYEWEMCGWRVILSLSILIRKLSWKTKLRAKTWNSQVCFVSPCILFARMCLKLVSTLPLKMEQLFPTFIVLTWMQTWEGSSNFVVPTCCQQLTFLFGNLWRKESNHATCILFLSYFINVQIEARKYTWS